MKKFCVYLLILFLFSCNKNNKEDLHPFQRAESYNGSIELSVEEKLLPTPLKIIDYLNELDNVSIYSAYELKNTEKELFINYYNLIPIKYQDIISKNVLGIYFINNFLGGGMTLSVFDNKEKMYIVLFFNPDILNQNITNWINYRDNSIFSDNEEINIMVNCNSEYKALIHTLLHEASHIYDFCNFVTPYTEKFQKNKQTIFPTDFIKGIWDDFDEPKNEYNYKNRENISFYDLGKRIDKMNAIEIYSSLKTTPFSSLYASKTWAEDFAECFTWYYLKNYCETDYTTEIIQGNKTIFIYNPNDNDLIQSRYKIFEDIIK